MLIICITIAVVLFPRFITPTGADAKPLFYGDISKASIEIGASESFTCEEIETAMAIALGRFTAYFKGAALVRLYYNEEISQSVFKRHIQDENKEGIVLFMDFKTGLSTSGWDSYGSYTDYFWLFTRDVSEYGWEYDWDELTRYGYE
jgi:hypothetical protein